MKRSMLCRRKQSSLFLVVTGRSGPGSSQSGHTRHMVRLGVRGGWQIPAARAPRATASSLKEEHCFQRLAPGWGRQASV